jgi:hypothetical protein
MLSEAHPKNNKNDQHPDRDSAVLQGLAGHTRSEGTSKRCLLLLAGGLPFRTEPVLLRQTQAATECSVYRGYFEYRRRWRNSHQHSTKYCTLEVEGGLCLIEARARK